MTRQMHLNVFLRDCGHHEAAWRHPASDPLSGRSIQYHQQLAQVAERGSLDSIFIADVIGFMTSPAKRSVDQLDPLTLATAIAPVTEHIGLIATASSTFSDPLNLARTLATLDWVSNGRAGWNVVTTGNADAAPFFGLEKLPDSVDRYRRASEFLRVAYGLWDCWDEDAFVGDRDTGVWADPAKIREFEHVGEFYKVRGRFNVPRSPQGRPVIVQAGSSGPGLDLAAAHAEAIFTAQNTLEDGQAFYAKVKKMVTAKGRNPEQVVVLPGLVTIIGSTEEEARRHEEELDRLIALDHQLDELADKVGIPASKLDLDAPLPSNIRSFAEDSSSRYELIVNLARRENLTVRELLLSFGRGRGHALVVGTPEQVADHIETWFTSAACDGFNVMPGVLPSGLHEFVDHVVPLLQKRGLFRHGYKGNHLRDHLGLSVPS